MKKIEIYQPVFDNRLSLSAKGVIAIIQEHDNTGLTVDYISSYSAANYQQVLNSLEELEHYQYIRREPRYENADWHSELFSCYVYYINLDRKMATFKYLNDEG